MATKFALGPYVIAQRQEMERRLAEVRAWLVTRWYGATRAQVAARFEWYAGAEVAGSRGERRWYRDRAQLLASGIVQVHGKLVRRDRAAFVSEESDEVAGY